MNLPNILTVLRIILTFIFVFFLCQDSLDAKVLALIVFTLASITDFLDGYIARKYDLISKFGKIMDPIADKFLMLSAFFIFMEIGLIEGWMFIIIFIREIVVTGLRLFAMGKGVTLAAEKAGKVKTVLQIAAAYLIIVFIVLVRLKIDTGWYGSLMVQWEKGINILMFGVVLITLWSGFSFIWNNRRGIFHVR